MSDDPNPEALQTLLSGLDVEPSGDDLYVGENQQGRGRLFGGLVAAQALVAAGRTAQGLPPHSLHAYFLRPGKARVPIRYSVTRLKEGRNFHARQVLAQQDDETIFSLQASFYRPEQGIEHQDSMPQVAPPEDMPPPSHRSRLRFSGAVEMRGHDDLNDAGAPRRMLWLRPAGPMPEDPLLHNALLTYMSDRMLMSTGAMRYSATHERRGGASLDHAVWFHRQPRFDDWVLYVMESPAAHAARALMHAAMYLRDGTRLRSVSQEGLRRREPKGESA